MATINFILQSDNNPSPIYVRIKEGRTIDAKAKTNYFINPNDWSTTKGLPKNPKDAELKKLNDNLVTLRFDLLHHFNNSVGKTQINAQWIKDFINPSAKPDSLPDQLISYMDHYAQANKNDVGASTFKKYNVYKRLVERFEKENRKKFLVNEVTADFKFKFENYCIQQGYAPNTIARTLKFIKSVCYHARNNGIDTHYQLDSLKAKQVKVDKIYLTKDELIKIENALLENDYQVNARDWLIISCETGQRVSDFMRFKKEFIRTENNVALIEFTQVKTNKIMTIPLSKKVLAILEQRNGDFPRQISDQRYNEYIKEVCKIAGLTDKIRGSKLNPETNRKQSGIFEKWELVTSHIGRRSFATNNYGRIPTALLISATGHTTEKMFLEYIGKTDTQKAIQLAEYF